MDWQSRNIETYQALQDAWLDAWMQTVQSATELAWSELYRGPMHLARLCAAGTLRMQAEFVRTSAALMNGGLFDAERTGTLCADPMQAGDRFLALEQRRSRTPRAKGAHRLTEEEAA